MWSSCRHTRLAVQARSAPIVYQLHLYSGIGWSSILSVPNAGLISRRALASLRGRRAGRRMMGSEDEAGQSMFRTRPARGMGSGTGATSSRPSSLRRISSFRCGTSSSLLCRVQFDDYAAAVSSPQRNGSPSTHMRCMMTSKRRASATRAFFMFPGPNLHSPD